MSQEAFRLTSRDEVVLCDQMLQAYCNSKVQFDLQHVSLASAFDSLGGRSDRSRLIASLFDIQICYHALLLDIVDVGRTWNEKFSVGKLEGGTVLDSEHKFVGKMDIYRHSSSFVLRYRSFWDKMMGFLLLLYRPDSYEQYIAARSRKRHFFRTGGDVPELVALVDGLADTLNSFDDTFRTSEAHGPGVLRKHTFVMGGIVEDPVTELSGYWNFANSFMVKFGKIF